MTKLAKILCSVCKKPIYRRAGWIKENLKLGLNSYCSKECKSIGRTQRRLIICENCGKEFARIPSAFSPHNYCSRHCAAKANNKKYPRKGNPKFKICIVCGQEYRKSTGNIKYCSRKCRKKAENYTPQELIGIIKSIAQDLGRTPARRELREIGDSCRRIFGSWNNAVIAAGFKPNRSHSQRMYKRTNTKARDGHLCDSVSEALIDNWFTQNNIFHEINVSYPETHHKADWAIFVNGQKVFVEYFGLAQDSPRYDRAIKRKQEISQKYDLILVEIYPSDIYPCEDINKKLKEKFRGLINL
ncbi:hypothetical protein KKD72_01920 [Patescibacteria group bacterium]|nr:hypothetical protein [Patescibacteria group bacterium]